MNKKGIFFRKCPPLPRKKEMVRVCGARRDNNENEWMNFLNQKINLKFSVWKIDPLRI